MSARPPSDKDHAHGGALVRASLGQHTPCGAGPEAGERPIATTEVLAIDSPLCTQRRGARGAWVTGTGSYGYRCLRWG